MKLIEESESLNIEQTVNSPGDEDERYFNKEVLESDLKCHEEWKTEAESVLSQLEDDEVAIS
jgi:hypothetical protein